MSAPAALQRATAAFNGYTVAQRVVAVVGVVVLLVGGVAFSRWASAPSYAPLFSGLAAEDASAIVEELEASGTPYELADGGATVMVPRESVYDARVALSGQGLPAGEPTGYSLLDEQGITASEFRQRVDYQRALEGELVKTVQAIDGVETAVVHLAIPEKDVFADASSEPTASVLVATRAGTELSSEQVRGVVHLVASSVEGLTPEKVTVTDASGEVLSADGPGGAGGAGDLRDERTRAFEERVAGELQRTLDAVVGPGNSVVTLTADLDLDATTTTTESFTAPPPGTPALSESTTEEEYTGSAAAGATGVLGPDNIAVPTGQGINGNQVGADAAAGGEPPSYRKATRTADNAAGKVSESRVATPGTVNRLSVAVVLDAATAGDVDIAEVTQVVSAGAGVDPARGDTVQVSRMPFDTTAAEAAEEELAAAAEAEERARLMGMARTGALALVIVLAALVAWLTGRKRRGEEQRERVELEVLEAERAALEAAKERFVLEQAERLAALDAAGGQRALDPADDAARQQIGQLVESQPDEVAQLLRGWLADRRS